VANLAVMGLQVSMPEVVAVFKNKKTLALIFVWGWVLGPALGYLITWVLPLAEPYVIVVLLSSLAPCAPYVPLMVAKARGDMNFTGALIPLVMVGAVVSIPLIGPLFVKGLTVTAGDLAKPLALTVFLPMVIGAAVRHYAVAVATKILPAVSVFARLTTLVMFLTVFVLFAQEMLDTVGSFASLAIIVFTVGMGLITYQFSFGLKQSQRSAMALGMGTRNSGALFPAILAIPNLDPLIMTMAIMWGLWQILISAIGARIFGKQAGKTVAGSTV
jgi:BASS family bile acid:Na+ symporter